MIDRDELAQATEEEAFRMIAAEVHQLTGLLIHEAHEGRHGRAAYQVDSKSGHTYTLQYCGSGDADPDYVALWECTCPAYQFGNGALCKHVQAVNRILDAVEDGWYE